MRDKKAYHILLWAGMILLFLPGFSDARTEDTPAEKVKESVWESLSGGFEVDIHYSDWSIDSIKSLFEDDLTDRLGDEIRDEIGRQVSGIDSSQLKSGDFENNLGFVSEGSNYGLEMRFYPRGKEGAFSLGFSVERTFMRFVIQGAVKQSFMTGNYAEVEAEGYLEMTPVSTNLSFRWDFGPKWIVSPYFIWGIGLAPLKGTFGYTFTGSYNSAGPTESIEGSDSWSFKEAEEEIEFNLPNIFILLHMSLGLRAKLFDRLILKVEGGFWDGFIIRGGIGFRF